MRHTTTIRILVALWLAAALVVTFTGALARIPALAPVSIAFGVALAVLVYRSPSAAGLRARLDGDLRIPILFHALRAPIGAWFLVEAGRGALPATFALRAGWGDVAAGLLAVAVALAWPYTTRARRALVVAWSLFGLADILMVIATANYLVFFAHDQQMVAAVARVPFPLLPTAIVPLVIATHALVIARVRAPMRQSPAAVS